MMVLLRASDGASDGDVNGESNDDGGDDYITLHYITLHYITLHYITLHYITLHYIIIQLTPHWSFSVTDYIKYYDTYVTYFSYLL